MTVAAARRMSVAEYLSWALSQPEGRYELVEGSVVAMSPERAYHNLVKARVWQALTSAVEKAGVPCTVYTDGMTVVINDNTARVPDALVQCGTPIDAEAVVADNPHIVVEVVSPSSERGDTGEKLVDYFSVPSIRHYLIVDPQKQVLIHHLRPTDGDIRTKIVGSGDLDLTPPGITIPIATIFTANQ